MAISGDLGIVDVETLSYLFPPTGPKVGHIDIFIYIYILFLPWIADSVCPCKGYLYSTDTSKKHLVAGALLFF